MRRAWLSIVAALAAVAAVGATAWLLLGDGRVVGLERSRAGARAAGSGSDDSGRDELPAAQRVHAEADDSDGEEVAPGASDLEAALVQAGLRSADAADGLEVAVVERIGRAPRPDVPVLLFAGDRPRAKDVWKRRLDPKWLRKEHAAALRSDREGKARFSLPAQGALLFAEQKDERGVLFVPPGTTAPATLELGAPLEIGIRVVDRGGEGRGGVAVAIAKRGRSTATSFLARATTGESGLATLRNLDLALNGRATSWHYWAGFAFPLGEVSGRDVDLDDAASTRKPVELELPPTGTLVLRIVAPDGSPVAVAGSVELHSRRVTADEKPGETPPHVPRESLKVKIAPDGTAKVANVGIGLHWKVTSALAGRQSAVVEADGPARADQQVTIDLPAGAAGPTVSGRALDGGGSPIVDSDLAAELVARDGPGPASKKSPARTDGDGRFSFDLSKAEPNARAGPATIAISRRAAHGAPPAAARLDLAEVPESVDVGDVVLSDLPLLAAGRVVDDRGEPVVGATVELVPAGGSEPGSTSPRGAHCRSHSEGRFELHGAAPGEPSALKASLRGYASGALAKLEVGDKELVLVLPRSGSIAGSLLLEEGLASRSFRVWVRGRDGAGGRDDYGVSAGIDSSGRFRFDGLAVGSYDVRIGLRTAGSDAVTHADVAGVEVRAAEITRDKRLAAVDVAQLLRLLALDVRDESGQPVASGRVATLATQGDAPLPRVEARLKNGKALLAGPADSFDLEVLASGFQPARLSAHPGTLDVVLKRGFRVHLIAPLDHPRDAGLVLERVKLVPASSEESKRVTAVLVDSTGEADAVVPLSGRYTAVLEYRQRDPTDDKGKSTDGKKSTEGKKSAEGGKSTASVSLEVSCEVADRPGTQTLRLPSPR